MFSYKTSEEKLQALKSALDAVSAHIAIKDLNGTYIYTNKLADNYYQKKYDTIVGMNYKELYSESEQKVVAALDQEVLQKEKTINKTIQIDTDEGYIFVDSFRAPVYNDSGEIIGIISIGQDATEREKTIRELKETILELKKMNVKYMNLSCEPAPTT
ncbi:MAG: PAS domain-containing protein [Candidatus Izimaplasma sp.]|nr:PAS domain-containing protein [Candidatus Izimaplasma bacterium]